MDLVELVRRCRDNDEDGWNEFNRWFGRLADRVLSRFSLMSPVEREEARDAARVRFALEISRDSLRATSSGEVANYGKVVVLNCGRTVWRRRRPQETLPVLLRETGPSPAERARHDAELDCIRRRLASWNPENRWLFMMKVEQVPAAAIKADLERLFGTFVSTGAVDVRFSRLRSELRRECGGPSA